MKSNTCQVKNSETFFFKSNIFDFFPIFDLKNALSNNLPTPSDHWSLTSFSQELYQRIAAATGESLAAVARMAEEERRNLATVLGLQVRVGVELS